MFQSILLVITGICCGTIVASAVTGFIISLSIIPRYAGITHTSSHLLLYEDAAVLGAFFGNIFYLFHINLLLGKPFLLIIGTFSGIFLGSLILSLAEMISVFPIFSRRIRLTRGFSFIIISIALGKLLGCLLFYYKHWQ